MWRCKCDEKSSRFAVLPHVSSVSSKLMCWLCSVICSDFLLFSLLGNSEFAVSSSFMACVASHILETHAFRFCFDTFLLVDSVLRCWEMSGGFRQLSRAKKL